MSLEAIYRELMEIPGAYGWNQLLGLMQHQLTRGETTSKHLSYYAMRILRRYREEQSQKTAREALARSRREPEGIGSLMDTAMKAQG